MNCILHPSCESHQEGWWWITKRRTVLINPVKTQPLTKEKECVWMCVFSSRFYHTHSCERGVRGPRASDCTSRVSLATRRHLHPCTHAQSHYSLWSIASAAVWGLADSSRSLVCILLSLSCRLSLFSCTQRPLSSPITLQYSTVSLAVWWPDLIVPPHWHHASVCEVDQVARRSIYDITERGGDALHCFRLRCISSGQTGACVCLCVSQYYNTMFVLWGFVDRWSLVIATIKQWSCCIWENRGLSALGTKHLVIFKTWYVYNHSKKVLGLFPSLSGAVWVLYFKSYISIDLYIQYITAR